MARTVLGKFYRGLDRKEQRRAVDGSNGRKKPESEAGGEPSHDHSSRVPWWGPQGSLEDAGLRRQCSLCSARLRAPGLPVLGR